MLVVLKGIVGNYRDFCLLNYFKFDKVKLIKERRKY